LRPAARCSTFCPACGGASASGSANCRASANPRDALIGLIDAETEALQVAGVAIENPYTPALGECADAAGARLLRAVTVYLRAVQAVLPD
jgi:hypothetical protein